jgi:hypothetical protein
MPSLMSAWSSIRRLVRLISDIEQVQVHRYVFPFFSVYEALKAVLFIKSDVSLVVQ